MTWRWDVDDIDFRATFARVNSPTDFFTVLARLVVSRVTLVLAFVLWPLDSVLRLVGKGLVSVVLGMIVLMVLDLSWLPVWGTLVGTSWLWLNYPWLRPILILPGMFLAILAHIYIMLAPDPHKNAKYPRLAGEWPLSWMLWRPPKAYFETQGQA